MTKSEDDIKLVRDALQETANDTVFGTPEHERQLYAIEALDRLCKAREAEEWHHINRGTLWEICEVGSNMGCVHGFGKTAHEAIANASMKLNTPKPDKIPSTQPIPAEAITPRYYHNGTEVRDIWTRLIATCYNEKDAKHIANCLNGATAEAPQGQAVNDGLVSALKAIIIEKDKFIRNENDSGGTISAMALISEYALTTASNTKPEVIVVNEGMKEALKECSSDLEAEILARAPGELPRRIERDMETVLRAKAALQASDLPRGGNLPSAREIREQALQELYEKIDLKRDRIRDEDGETDTVIGMGYCLDMIIQMRRALKDGGA